jgi:hypothetical protein
MNFFPHWLVLVASIQIVKGSFHILDYLDAASVEEVYGISSQCRIALYALTSPDREQC